MKVAIIPASSTSKRLPGKNTLPVNGRPMITYPIEAAQESGLFDEVIVSSKDDEITAIAKEWGCRVFPAPMSLRRDKSTVKLVCQSVIEVMQSLGEEPDYFCAIYPTAILLEAGDIIESQKLLADTDFVMGVSEFIYEPEHAMVVQAGYLRPVNHKSLVFKASYFPPKYSSNGTLYWCRTKPFMVVKDFYGPRLLGYVIPKTRVWDINTAEDLEIATMLKNKACMDKAGG